MCLPLVSVVIPTHNRSQYAVSCIESLLRINSDKMEVVMSDTSTNDDLRNRLASLDMAASQTGLRYFKPERPLHMTENHNVALASARGHYVCLIGDDDTVTHEIIDAAEWAEKNGIDCLSPNMVSNYAWPDFRSRSFGAGHAGRLYLPQRIGSLQRVAGAKALATALDNAGQGTEGLPKLYHGLVRREVLEDVRRHSGEYFHGSSPDVSMAVSLAYLLANRQGSFYTIDYPLTIPGASGGSNTGRSAMNQHKGDLSSEKQTSDFVNSYWPCGVPRFFSVETVWAHACISALSAMGASDSLHNYNYSRLLASCFNAHPEFHNESNKALDAAAEKMGIPIAKMAKTVNRERMRLLLRRFRYLAQRALWPTASGGRKFVADIQCIADTSAILQSWLDNKKLNFAKVVSV
ncbi:MAG: glycosyltransferase [Rhodoferax sp.]|nr:glycosyltransferase [Rhodoferax sp.]